MRHIIDLSDLTDKEFNDLYKLTTNIIDRPEGYVDACRGKVLGSLFYEPSTRTNLSFSTAMMRLGGSVVGFSDPRSSSTTKGETLKDTINMVSCYADMIVMRNPREGAAKAASLYSSVPVINAGDGGHLHPTQTLADMVTILRMRGSADDMKIGLCGDLKYGRTVHSLMHALSRYEGIEFVLISPEELRGVIAHEIGHIANRDILIQTIAGVLASVIVSIANFMQFAAIFGGSSNDEEGGTNPIAAFLLAILAPIAASIIQMAISRSREYLADETGARICGQPLALAGALHKLGVASGQIPMQNGNPSTEQMFIVSPLFGFGGGSMANLFSTHPPLEERIARLQEMSRQAR